MTELRTIDGPPPIGFGAGALVVTVVADVSVIAATDLAITAGVSVMLTGILCPHAMASASSVIVASFLM
jgi:hypothetical protein